MIKTVTKDDLIELGFAPGTARKIIHTGKLLLVNRGFNIYDNKRIGTIPASVAEELLELNSRKKHNEWLYVKAKVEHGLSMFPMV